MAINFPASPSNNDIFQDAVSGNRYKYDARSNVWLYTANNVLGSGLTSNTQVIYDVNGGVGGSYGLTFDQGANTLTANTINAYSMRVTGNLYIGSNTVTISNNSIYAESIFVNGTAIPTGEQSNAIYDLVNVAFTVANSAYAAQNSDYTSSNAAYSLANATYASVNSAFGVINAAYDMANTNYAVTNAAYTMANMNYTVTNAAYVSVNSAYTAVNSAYDFTNVSVISANSWANQVALSANSWANTVAISANGWANTVAISANGWANTVGLSANGWANTVALSANGWANTVGLSANGWANTVALSANGWANTVALSANGWANTVAISANNYSGYMANASNTYANNTFLKLSGGTIAGDLQITGNITITGASEYVNVTNYKVQDSLMYLADQNYASDILEIGFLGNYNNGACTTVHTGLFRAPSTKEYYLFYGYDKEPTGNYIDPAGNNITRAVLNADIRTSNLNLGSANAITWISSAYGVANAAFDKANTLATSSNAYATSVGASANAYTAATYAPLGGSGTSGTWGISVTGSAGSISGLNNPPTNTGGTYPHLVKVNSDGAVEVGRYLDFHNGSADGLDYAVRLETGGTTTGLTLNGNQVLTAGNYSSYALPLAGGTMSGTIYSTTNSLVIGQASSATRGYLYNDTSGFGLLTSGGGWAVRVDYGTSNVYFPGYAYASGSFRAPIFYDSDNTGYYLDAASTSNFNSIVVNSSIKRNAAATGYLDGQYSGAESSYTTGAIYTIGGASYYPTSSSFNTMYGIGYTHTNSGLLPSDAAGWGMYVCSAGTVRVFLDSEVGRVIAAADMRSPIYYDRGDTAYYTDPNSTSRMYQINYNSLYYAPDTNYGFITTSVYADTINSGYASDPLELCYVRGTWCGISHDSLRAPIYYDYNDTAYYVDPNSLSIFNTIRSADNWWQDGGGNNRMLWGYASHSYYRTWSYHVFRNSANNDCHYLAGDGNIWTSLWGDWVSNQWRSPIYYDYSDTGYYCDPNSTSSLNGVTARTKDRIGLTAKYNTPRSDSTGDSNYWTGVMGWGTTDLNTIWDYGSGFWDSWSSPGNAPAGSSHWDGFNIQHYNAGNGTRYGWQMCMGAGSPGLLYVRGQWGSNNATSWYRVVTYDINSYASALYATVYYDANDTGYYDDPNSTGTCYRGAGTIYVNGNVVAYYSDERLKTKLGYVENALDKVMSLTAFYYEANDEAQRLGYKPVRELGLSAQEVQKVLPEVVKPAPVNNKYLTLDYERLVPLLVEAIKEQQAQIDELKRQVSGN